MEQSTERELSYLIALFERAEAEVARQLAEATASGDMDTAVNRRQKRAQLRGILAALLQSTLGEPGRLDEELESDSPAWRVIRMAYTDGANAASLNMKRNGVPGLSRSFTQTHQDAAEVLYENLRDRLIDAVGFVGRKSDDVFRRVALEEVTQKIVQGRTRQRTSTAIADRLRERGVKAFRDRRGREMDLGKYAEMVARTTTREAVTMGTLNRIAESGVDLIRVSKHSGSCKICKPFEDNIYAIREGHETYPTMTDVPPFHPNCGHVIYPVVEDLIPGEPPAEAADTPADKTYEVTGVSTPVAESRLEIAKDAEQFLKTRFPNRTSLWKGELEIAPVASMPGVGGAKSPTCRIRLREDVAQSLSRSYATLLHEMLHSYSGMSNPGAWNYQFYQQYPGIEEGVVEALNRDYLPDFLESRGLNRNAIPNYSGHPYNEYIEAYEEVRISLRQPRRSFYKWLVVIEPTERYDELRDAGEQLDDYNERVRARSALLNLIEVSRVLRGAQ